MTTATHDVVSIGPGGLVTICSYCLSTARRAELHAQYAVSDGCCPTCLSRLMAELDRREP